MGLDAIEYTPSTKCNGAVSLAPVSTVDLPSPPTRGRPRDPAIRVRVLTVAATQFTERGYGALTMEGVVAASGVAKRTLYRWWPSKAMLITDAILGGFLDVPRNSVPHTGDVWADLSAWLSEASAAMQGPYGEVLRAATSISAAEPALGAELAQVFRRPALIDIRARLSEAVRAGQISETADLDAAIDVLMAIIVFVGATREDVSRIPAVIAIIRSGIAS
jgi:AcrR family transcriptional regulator